MTPEERQELADEIRAFIEPRIDVSNYDGGYDCCGCSTYEWILEDAIEIVLGNTPRRRRVSGGYYEDAP